MNKICISTQTSTVCVSPLAMAVCGVVVLGAAAIAELRAVGDAAVAAAEAAGGAGAAAVVAADDEPAPSLPPSPPSMDED